LSRSGVVPGSGRRDWVMRELALLGADAAPSALHDAEASAAQR